MPPKANSIFGDYGQYTTQLHIAETAVLGHTHFLQPNLRLAASAVDVNVRRFVPISRKK